MERRRYQNLLRERLGSGQFVASIEFVTPEASDELEGAIAPLIDLAEHIKADSRFHTIAITDRVKSDHDHDPVLVGARVAEACGKMPTVHLSGKDRDAAWTADALRRLEASGLDDLLVVTGDKVKVEPGGRQVRYYDSVNMVAQARAAGAFHIAAAVSPFKYREEDLMNQYLKMAKKEKAGADCFITQVGWDMLKLKELMAYRRRRGFMAPVMGGVMLLTVARARYIRQNKLAGITITDALQARLEEEAKQPDKGVGAAYRRLALQIVGLRRLGFAGFQLTGMHQFEKLDKLFRQIDGLERGLTHEGAWWDAWWLALRGHERAPVVTAPRPYYLCKELAEPGGWSLPSDRLTLRDLDPPAALHVVRVPRDLSEGPRQRPLRRHQREHLRVRGSRVHPQPQVSDRPGRRAPRRAGGRAHPGCRRDDARHVLVDEPFPGRGSRRRPPERDPSERKPGMIEHQGLIVIGENLNATRKIKGSSPRILKDGDKRGLGYTDLSGTKRVLDLTDAFPEDR